MWVNASRFAARFLWVLAFTAGNGAAGQGETTSAITGQVTDQTGAALPKAGVAITATETGLKRTAKTDDAGRYSFPQLRPGKYDVEADLQGFERQRKQAVTAGLGQTQEVDFVLPVAAAHADIVVGGEAPLINTENPNTATTLDATAIENLPNPGSDLTYPAQFSPGALINTAGSGNDFVGAQNGYGNFQVNGLPALSNAYIVDGLETNDPLTNLNSGLATNLVLGLNSISEVTVNTTSYAVDQGRYGASQVNYVTKSGTNSWHGNLYELWNGSRLNAADFFTNATAGNQKPRSTVNHFGGSLGGPIVRDKLFFFFDYEQLRIAVPIVSPVTVPSAAFAGYVLDQLPRGGVDSVSGAAYPAQPGLVPFYRNLFALYGEPRGTAVPVLGCPFNANGAAAVGAPPNGDGCALRRSVSQSSGDHEQVITARIDHNLSVADTVWYRFQSDTGLQAAYTDAINPLFDAISSQPLYSFAAGYTHLFSQHLVNYFNPAFSWYKSLFGPPNPASTLAAFPIVLEGAGTNAPFTTLGGLDYNWVQGRRAARFHLNDNLSWVTGRHDFKFGVSSRLLRLNDYDFSTYTTPLVTYTTLPQFIYGAASTATRAFPDGGIAAFPLSERGFVRAGFDQAGCAFELDGGSPAGAQFESGESARSDRTLAGIVRRNRARRESTAERRLADGPVESFCGDAVGGVATSLGGGVAVQAGMGCALRVWRVCGHSAGQRRGFDRHESTVREHVSGRFAGRGGRIGDCTGSARQRHRQDGRGESGVHRGLSERRAFVRVARGAGRPLSAAGGADRCAGRKATRAVFPAVESGDGAPIGEVSQRARSIRRHAGDQSAVPGADEWIPDGLRGMLRAVSLWAAG